MTQQPPATQPQAAPSNGPPPAKKDQSKLVILVASGCGCLLLVGVLVAAIGIPAFITYIKKSKSTEAKSNLGALARLVEQECEMQGGYAGIAPAGPVPPTPPAGTQATGAFGSDPGFARVGFRPNPVIYSYSIQPNAGGGVDLVAQGDLDGDGLRSTYTVACDASCRCDTGAMHVMDELE